MKRNKRKYPLKMEMEMKMKFFTFAWQKNILFLFFSILCINIWGAEATAEVFLLPENVVVNEPAFLVLQMNNKKPDVKKLPVVKNLRWIRNSVRTSSRVSIVNGKMTSTYENHIPFVVTAKGKYVIPVTALINGASSSVKEIVFHADEPKIKTMEERKKEEKNAEKKQENIKMEDAIFSHVEIPGKKKFYYVGEEIPLQVDLYVLRGLSGKPLAYPSITFGEKNAAVFRDYKRSNPENGNFERITRSPKKIGSRIYECWSFHTRFTPVSPGEMKIRTLLPALLLVPEERGNARRPRSGFFDDDDFFGSFFRQERRIERNLPSSTLISVLPQPQLLPDKNAVFTGLVGNWEGKATLSPPPYKSGELLNLTIRYTGNGSLDFLKAPTLSLAGFRVYPPEVEKGRNFAEIRYILIPSGEMAEKEATLSLPPLAVLRPETGKYSLLRYSAKIKIEKGNTLLPSREAKIVVDGSKNGGETSSFGEGEEKREHADDVLYLKKEAGSMISLPLWKNNIFYSLFILLAGLLLLAGSESIAFYRRVRKNDPAFARRKQGNLLRKKLIRDLEKLPAENVIRESGKIAESLAGLLELPPGADLAQCAEKVEEEDPVLAAMLQEISSAAWMPEMKNDFDEKKKKEFLKRFSLFSLFLMGCMVFSTIFMMPQNVYAIEDIKKEKSGEIPSSLSAAIKEYDAGNFKKAEKFYLSELKKGRYSAAILYNLGNTLYRMGRYPEALLQYERALRLSPRDPDVLENLNLVRRKLSLGEKGKIDSPKDIFPVWRDDLRPDEWLLCFSISFFLLCAALSLRAFAGNRSLFFRTGGIAGVLFMILSLVCFFTQMNSSYSGKYAIIMKEAPPVYSLPSAKSETLSMKFHAGEEVKIAERRTDFLRVRSGNMEGWIPVKYVEELAKNIK